MVVIRQTCIKGGGAVGGAVGFDDPTGLTGKFTKDLVDVGARRELIATVFPQAMEDVGGDGPSLSLSHLRLLLLLLTPTPPHNLHPPSSSIITTATPTGPC